MERLQKAQILKDLEKKLVFLVGPRQVGKTWLAKDIGAGFGKTVYLNYDSLSDRKIIKKEAWLKNTELLILDELHKMPRWKNFLKGVFDTRTPGMRILVTGSARLDLLRQAGDSMAGRYFTHHLLPLSPVELRGTAFEGGVERLMSRGGFPEPFLSEDPVDADRWRREYADGLLRRDIFEVDKVQDLRAIQLVLDLLRERVGTPVSYSSIARDVEVAPNTVKKFIRILEALCIVFRVVPHTASVARSLLKNPKIYFFDNGIVKGGPGPVFENFAAVCLLKHVTGKTDYEGKEYSLRYIRTKEGREVDFCIVREGKPELLVEAKASGEDFDKSLAAFAQSLGAHGVQVVRDLKNERRDGRLELRGAGTFFGEMFL
ncbi:MAG: ATP-binding protein [Deltaproteobacteria bacterium]|nr:ATP-binding protein [Deltaproteobacteria bacterium]